MKLNGTIDNFETHYKPILNRIQEADEYQINFVKAHMNIFANSIEAIGINLKERGEDILQAVAQINSETDLKIFVESHKSQNPFLCKEEFQVYENKSEVIKESGNGNNINTNNTVV